jgi:hydrogenase maturation protein HypF
MRLIVKGRVQGVGFRPAIARLAHKFSLAGHVFNTGAGVEIIIEGTSAGTAGFQRAIHDHAPHLARIDGVELEHQPCRGRVGFTVLAGAQTASIGTPVPLDLVVCRECLDDIQRAGSRREEYPFASCTNCGPRYSILASLPYERASTSMAAFRLCESCRHEYELPSDRRFHAETIACDACGPSVRLCEANGRVIQEGKAAIVAARAAILQGQIVALRGIGGYQFLADATRGAGVRMLREKKQRGAKPFAILFHSLDSARSVAWIDEAGERALAHPSGPIVVLPARDDSPLDRDNYPGLAEVGVMLATSPLHWLIAQDCPPLVATSGNIEGQPLEHDVGGAHTRLAGLAQVFLDHDRPIRRPIDDSVVKVIGGKPVTIRAARGVAPLPLEFGDFGAHAGGTCIVAVGSQQNNAIALWNGSQAALGPHVGDLDELQTCERWHSHRRDFCQLYGAQPVLAAHDLHPDYYTTQWAVDSGLKTVAVQHHHAHVAAGMLEHGWLDREVLGVAWDGTGWGPDGTIWGGEFLRVTAGSFRRVGRLRPFSLLGGEAAIREPWRVALALLAEVAGVDGAVGYLAERGWRREVSSGIRRLLARRDLSVQTSSVGRLFDAVATIVLPFDRTGGGRAQFEGQLAMLLEAACEWPAWFDQSAARLETPYPLPFMAGDGFFELDWRPLISSMVDDGIRQVAVSTIALRFHAALASAIAAASDSCSDLPVVLGGGVFHNRVLTEMVLHFFAKRRPPLGVPGLIPPGDGGLAAGQLVVALARPG